LHKGIKYNRIIKGLGTGVYMEVYVARQPIFDRNMNIYGYELLYRRSANNFYEGLDDGQATSELIHNAFLVMQFDDLTNGNRAFINFSEDLLEKEIPFLLSEDTIVVEILERVKVTDTLIKSCKKLKENGYTIALDDYIFQETFLPLVKLADIIKVEFNGSDLDQQRKLIKENKEKTFLAEKIETIEDYRIALNMGYDLFQGYFFSKPVILTGKKIEILNSSLIKMIEALNQEEPDLQQITEIIEKDLALSYKLLKMANSVIFASKSRIYSIKQALVRLGIEELKKWVYLMALRGIQNKRNQELINNCLIRGKLMELIALETGMKNKHLEFFLTGMFSSIDTLLNRNMEDIIDELPLTEDVKEALLKKDNELKKVLDIVLCYEMANWVEPGKRFIDNMANDCFVNLYIKALRWVNEVSY